MSRGGVGLCGWGFVRSFHLPTPTRWPRLREGEDGPANVSSHPVLWASGTTFFVLQAVPEVYSARQRRQVCNGDRLLQAGGVSIHPASVTGWAAGEEEGVCCLQAPGWVGM